MPMVVLEHPSGSRAEVYLHGAQVASWIPENGREMLFVSRRAIFSAGKAIRGGIPVVFPQFADSGPLPKHGWLRTSEWKVAERQRADAVTLVIENDSASIALWPHTYRVELTVSIGADWLDVSMSVHNPGAETFDFSAALHTYLSVGDVERVEINGLDDTSFIDKVRGGIVVEAGQGALRISSETDRIYMDVKNPVALREQGSGEKLEVVASGFPDVVIWNPGSEVTKGIADMLPGEYRDMVCIEAAAAAKPLTLEPLSTWRGSQHLAVMRP